ncbi:hypothetical protein BDV23DRAFT_188255 [Aspergillus alliaceus]|uniref:Uncharacterized protein n=1 Tax=Petromyces alliaceus TaxID=209559 RepID=A0A5N7BUD8_PETAA|nr:hypothetical protein BDV23DRAFT_188255 [Aspergillus alliaceus]
MPERYLLSQEEIALSAHTDLLCFLEQQHREIRPQGFLILAIPISSELKTRAELVSLKGCLEGLAHECVISSEVASRFQSGAYLRSWEEVCLALWKVTDKWAIESQYVKDTADPAYLGFLEAAAVHKENYGIVVGRLAKSMYEVFLAMTGECLMEVVDTFPLAGLRANYWETVFGPRAGIYRNPTIENVY